MRAISRTRAPQLALNLGPPLHPGARREFSATRGCEQQGARPPPASPAAARAAPTPAPQPQPAAGARSGLQQGPSAPAQAFVQRLFGQSAAGAAPIFGKAPASPFLAPKPATAQYPATAAAPGVQRASTPAPGLWPSAPGSRPGPLASSAGPGGSSSDHRAPAAPRPPQPPQSVAQQLWNVSPGQLARHRSNLQSAAAATGPGTAGGGSRGGPAAATPSTTAGSGGAQASPTAADAAVALTPSAQSTVDTFRRMRESFAAMRVQAQKAAVESRARVVGGGGTPGGVRSPFTASASSGAGRGAGANKVSYREQVTVMKARAAGRQQAAALQADGGAAGVSEKGRPRSVKGMFRSVATAARSATAVAAARRAAHLARTVVIVDDMTPRMLALAMGLTLGRVLARLADLGESAAGGGDAPLDPEVAEIIVQDEGQRVKREDSKRRDRVRTPPASAEQAAAKGYPPRAPVVAVMGHVDHGKTTLLDALRGTNVAEREAGGITQGVAAFSVPMRAAASGTGDRRAPGGKGSKSATAKAAATARAVAARGSSSSKGGAASAPTPGASSSSSSSSSVDVMTFIDTPGHALFASMRRRGTAVTDVVVLVVDGRDGVMPQTKECVSILLEAALPCVVAVTKCDALSDADKAVESVAKQLLELGLVTEGYNGDCPIVAISAKTGLGLSELKEAISLQAELLELRAPSGAGTLGEATVVDSRALKGSGACVDVIVRWGSLRVGDVVVAGEESGRIKALQTDAVGAASVNRRLLLGAGAAAAAGGKVKGGGAPPSDGDGGGLATVTEAPPGTPVRVLGLRGIPPPGCDLLVVEDEERAKAVVEGRVRRRQAGEAAAVAAADAVTRAAERRAYSEKRQLKLAFETAKTRERKRATLKRAGLPVPPALVAAPWEVAVLAQGAAGKIPGVGSALRTSVQGAQQAEVAMTYAQAQAGAEAAAAAGGERDDAAAPPAPAGPKQVAFIVKTDTGGALAAVGDALARIPAFTSEVLPRVVHTGVGEVTERDVELAGDMGAHVLAFNAKVPPNVAKAAERRKVRLLSGRVIYHLLDEVCELLSEYMTPTLEEEVAAVAEVKQRFTVNAKRSDGDGGTAVAGCVILEGTFLKSGMTCFRLMRGDALVGEARELASLMHLKDRVESVKKGSECGVALQGVSDYVQGDRILAIKRKSVKPKLAVRYD